MKTGQPREANPLWSNANSLTYFNSRGGTRTPDPVINSHLLYQLSYSGSFQCRSIQGRDNPNLPI
jgi:hypothetical protein